MATTETETIASDLPRFAPTDPLDAIVDALRADGAVIVERLVDTALCDRIEAELAPHVSDTPLGADRFTGHNTTRTGALLARSPSVCDLVAHPLVLDVVDAVLWPSKTTFQLHLTQAIAIGPDSPAQPLHRDQWCFDFFPFPDDVEVEVSTIWALSDFTEANGATRVVPRSHLPGVDPGALRSADTVAATMPRGSVVLYTGRTVHGGGANTTNEVRTGINVDYVLGWLRQEENQYLSVPIETVRELPDRVQRLMGYEMGCYALGYVGDLQNPMAMLRDDPASGPASFTP